MLPQCTPDGDLLSHDPKLGHITTFGGHPVIAAACLATLQELTETNIIAETLEKEALFRKTLVHPLIKEIRGKGLMLAAIVESNEIAANIIHKCLEEGLILFFLLFEGKAIRITPPLTISKKEISKEEAEKILKEHQKQDHNHEHDHDHDHDHPEEKKASNPAKSEKKPKPSAPKKPSTKKVSKK